VPRTSFRLLGYSDEIRAENSFIFCITANGPDVSRDLITRSVVVNLVFEGDPARREFTIPDAEGYAREHRLEILGELVGMVERWRTAGSPVAEAASRFNKKGWSPIVGGVLAANGFEGFLSNAREAAESLDDVRRDFVYLVAALADHPQGVWTPAELVDLAEHHKLFADEFRDLAARAKSTRIGLIAGRYVGERFPLGDERIAEFRRREERKGNVYFVNIPDPDVPP
jgi:hypothetical protein